MLRIIAVALPVSGSNRPIQSISRSSAHSWRVRMTALNVLIVDDSPSDSELIALALRRAGYQPTCQRVDTPGSLAAALRGRIQWDVITCDDEMPQLNTRSAVGLARGLAPTVPVVVVSDAIDRHEAREFGACAVVGKVRLDTLGETIRQLRRRRVE